MIQTFHLEIDKECAALVLGEEITVDLVARDEYLNDPSEPLIVFDEHEVVRMCLLVFLDIESDLKVQADDVLEPEVPLVDLVSFFLWYELQVRIVVDALPRSYEMVHADRMRFLFRYRIDRVCQEKYKQKNKDLSFCDVHCMLLFCESAATTVSQDGEARNCARHACFWCKIERMNAFWKGTLWVIFFLLLLAAGFLAYTKWWDTGLLPRLMGEVKGTAVEAVQRTATDVVGEAKQSATDYAKQAGAGIVSSVGQSLLRFAASIVGETTSTSSTTDAPASTNPLPGAAASGTLPKAETSGFLLPPPATTVVTNVGSPLTFSINRNTSYQVDWGDGVMDSGSVASDASKVLTHSWGKEGDYTVLFRLEGSTSSSFSYSFPVRVYSLE